MNASQTKTLETIKALGGKDVDITYNVRGIHRSSVEALIREGVLAARTEAVELEPGVFRSYPNSYVSVA